MFIDTYQASVVLVIGMEDWGTTLIKIIFKFSDNLLNAVFEFLEALLYLWLPLDQCYMAAHYSESGNIYYF